MKHVTKVGIAVVILIIVLGLIDLLTAGGIRYGFSSIAYNTKSNVDYVSEHFDVTITRSYKFGKSYTYHCIDDNSGLEQYIFLDYRTKDFIFVSASMGVSLDEALQIIEEAGYSSNMSELLIFDDGSSNDLNIIGQLKWIVFHDSLKGSIYVNFEDGSLYIDGM